MTHSVEVIVAALACLACGLVVGFEVDVWVRARVSWWRKQRRLGGYIR